MPRAGTNDLVAFLTVARERSFTRAAAQIGVSPSALSHSIRGLEERLGVRLLTRTTRSVTPTEAGERLLGSVGPMFDQIDAELAALSAFLDKPAGNIRITTDEPAMGLVLRPALRRFLPEYPDVNVEVVIDGTLTDIVAERFDAGIRLGTTVAKDMVAVRVGPDLPVAVVATPDYFATHPVPRTPHDLTEHRCVNLRLPTRGGLYAWEFAKNGEEVRVRVEGQLVLSSVNAKLDAALDGHGVAFALRDTVQTHIDAGRLVSVLEEWCEPFEGYHLYYPSRRQPTPAFRAFVEALRYRGTGSASA
ncbi:MAG TPA: LysR family transcriptional regulator [Methylobacterium sp.]|jgi:DNA-binding transcriptional LysR family regulator|nr:LysR family transcriptional regulator [Methylobacterium sp.]